MNTTEKFEQWCIIELMGHQKIAGKCTEQNIAGANMLRVDVPEIKLVDACSGNPGGRYLPGFTRFYASSAVYCIHPVDEGTATAMAGRLQQQPITIWDIQEILKTQPKQLVQAHGEEDDDDDGGF
ncbi:hypothetical protein [Chitinophaga tropicalis]|uniref:Uncharacterized protein n=1 Tax=Chitinophaga tropicalis TaxID=2683588 RepID=A0A7K1UAR4_9BACT|nr:hypothetical protein [Chitinophaga tropicalis]MVT11350.1 hypothetical protein [Chitinophaga tropicalis]